MRKIELEMTRAARARRDWRSGNTSVDVTDHGVIVRLHGNKIAQIDGDTLYLTDCGWQTSTTKSRLNSLLREFTNGGYIYQSKFEWHLVYPDGCDCEMYSDTTYDILCAA